MEKIIAIIAKSAKGLGFCVVGIDLETNKFIRLVASDNASTNEITDNYMTYINHSKVNVLDVAKFRLKKYLPDKLQVENYLIDSSCPPSKVKIFKLDDLKKYISNDEYIYTNDSEKLSLEEVSNINKTIAIFRVNNLRLFPSTYEANKTLAYFNYNGIAYKRLRITDTNYKNIKIQTNINDALIVVTLPANPSQYNGLYYKIIAKIFQLV